MNFDKFGDIERECGSPEKILINLGTELNFAQKLHSSAIQRREDLPDVITWLSEGETLKNNWELFKVATIGQIEDKDTDKEAKEMLVNFLDTDLAMYMDLMSSIWINFSDVFTDDN